MENLIDNLNKFKLQKKVLKENVQVKRALVIQKTKFLCAIGKADPPIVNDSDERFVQSCFKKQESTDSKPFSSLLWSDTIALNTVQQILSEHQKFNIKLYLNCAKAIFLAYSDIIAPSDTIYEAFIYILTHARSFENPSKNIFKLEKGGFVNIRFRDIYKPLPDTFYMSKIKILIDQLNTKYDHKKYQTLNNNVTYLTLLIIRRFIGNENQFVTSFKAAQEDYTKLCPSPLADLPKISPNFNKKIRPQQLKSSAILAIHAYLTGDEKTKKVLRATCVQFVEWTGLQLPCLFFKVARLYSISESLLWNDLSRSNKTHASLYNLSKDYYEQYKNSLLQPPKLANWFPYCRALDGDYHKSLSATENLHTCLILAYLVDLMIGFEVSFVRDSHWAKKIDDAEKSALLFEARAMFEQLSCD